MTMFTIAAIYYALSRTVMLWTIRVEPATGFMTGFVLVPFLFEGAVLAGTLRDIWDAS